MIELLRNEYLSLERFPGRSVLRMTRHAKPFATIAELRTHFDAMKQAIEREGRDRNAIVLDLRNGPLRSDPEFEAALAPYRTFLTTGFTRIAVLVRTAVGKLQVQRHARNDGATLGVFEDEAEALAHVNARPSSPR